MYGGGSEFYPPDLGHQLRHAAAAAGIAIVVPAVPRTSMQCYTHRTFINGEFLLFDGLKRG